MTTAFETRGSVIRSIAPASEQVLGEVAGTPATRVPELVAAARAAQHAWERAGAVFRADAVGRLGRLIDQNAAELAELLAVEVGKPLAEARAEVDRSARICAYLVGVGYELGGVLRRSGDPSVAIIARQVPVGVAAVITPWNFPLAIPVWKIAPALVAGCTVLWKPAAPAVLCAERLAALAAEAGIPDGVLSCLPGEADVGEALASSDIDALSFTGSTAVGRVLRQQLGGRSRPRLTLELGGVNIAHVLADAHIPATAAHLVSGAYGFAGQKCTATQVIAVDEVVADELVDALRQELASLRIGDPLDEGVVCGPVIDTAAAARLRDRLEQLRGPTELIAEVAAPPGSAYVSPTLVLDREGASEMVSTELFGPVAALVPMHSAEDRARLSRLSGMGLTAAIHSQDPDRVRSMLNLVGTGVVAVNRPSTGLDPHVPFGGWSESGGDFSEQGGEGLRFYLKWQTVYWRSDDPEGYLP